MTDLCHCGKPLHYTDKQVEAYVTEFVRMLGPTVDTVLPDGRVFAVPRHYIALHGVTAASIPTLGFAELCRMCRKPLPCQEHRTQ